MTTRKQKQAERLVRDYFQCTSSQTVTTDDVCENIMNRWGIVADSAVVASVLEDMARLGTADRMGNAWPNVTVYKVHKYRGI